MILLTVDEIKRLHEKLLMATGGLSGIRDIGLLESAVYSAMQPLVMKKPIPPLRRKPPA